MKDLTEKQKQKESCILENASILFAEKGYFDTDILSIATKSNVGKGTIYNYFANKEDIFLKVIKFQLNTSLNNIMNKLKGIIDIKLYVEAYIEKALDYYIENTYTFELLFQANRTLFDKSMAIISETQSEHLKKFKEQFAKDFEEMDSIKYPELIFLTIQAGIFAMVWELKKRKKFDLKDIKKMLKSLYIDGLISNIK